MRIGLRALSAAALGTVVLAGCGAARPAHLHRAAAVAHRAHASPTVAANGGWTGSGMVSAPGGPYLVDAFGRRLQLHGADLADKCGAGQVPQNVAGTPCVGSQVGPNVPYVPVADARDPGLRFTEADAATLQALGFNVVRLGIVWAGMEPGPRGAHADDPTYCAAHRAGTPYPPLGRADPYDARTVATYLGRVDTVVSMLAAHGIRVIVDMQEDAFGSQFHNPAGASPWEGEGAPAWATCTDGRPFHAPGNWGLAARTPPVVAADHHFFANDVRGDLQGQFTRVWQAVATHYAGDDDVLGYEVLNEPADFTHVRMDSELQCDYGGPVHEPLSCRRSGAQALPDGWIGAIREADPDHVVFYEPPIYDKPKLHELVGISEPLRFANLAYAFHVYHPASMLRSTIAPELAHTRTLQKGGPPAIMDEFGGTAGAIDATADVAAADADHYSWSYWAALQLDDPTGNVGEYLMAPDGHAVPAKVRALSLPYPMATAGTPGAVSWSAAARRFTYAYRVDAAIHAPTEIVVPRAIYPAGYRVSAAGARVVSARGAAILQLSARAGARIVRVTVSA